MIGYVTLGTNDLPKAAAFYDALLGELEAKRMMEMDRFIAWSTGPGTPAIAVCTPFDEKDACVGNGAMLALAVDGKEKVDAMYNKAIELGATCDGPPGERMPGFYAAYFRDLDGNKLNFFFMG